MRHLVLALTVLLASLTPAMGQGGFVIHKLKKISDEERALLRNGFNLPDSAPITEVKAKALAVSPAAAMKINLESVVDSKVREGVANWVAEWNQKEANKYGRIEIVPDSLKADVTVVRYLRALPPTDPISVMAWTDPKGKVHRLIPVYSYLMVRKADGLDILWRKVDLTYQEEYEFSVKLLRDELKNLMKERAKARKS